MKNVIIFVEGDDYMVCKPGTKVITVRLSEEEKFQVELMAHAENRSVNNFILTIIRDYLKQKR